MQADASKDSTIPRSEKLDEQAIGVPTPVKLFQRLSTVKDLRAKSKFLPKIAGLLGDRFVF